MAQVAFFFTLFTLFLITPAISNSTGFRVDMVHVDSTGNFTKPELLLRAVRRTKHRLATMAAKLAGSVSGVRAPVLVSDAQYPTNIEYLVNLAIGSPSMPFPAIIDTGSDLICTQCQPCRCVAQPTPIFDPSLSSTFSMLPCSSDSCKALPNSECDYTYGYADNSMTQGVLATETFTIGSDMVADVSFGCGTSNQGDFTNAAGIVGLGRGALSLVSQLGLGKFSYCLTPNTESTSTSPLLIGSLAVLQGTGQSTPLLPNPYDPTDNFYYLNLRGITVGTTQLQIPESTFTLNPDGTGGFLIDSGSTLTSLNEAAYEPLVDALKSQVNLPLADGSSLDLDLCFSSPSGTSVNWPNLIFHFDGADMNLPSANYMASDPSTGTACLTILGSNGMSVLGNFQQQSMQILYDLQGGMLSFVPTQCEQL